MTLCLLVHGCDTVSGGAVELSWKLRPASSALDEKFVDCDSTQPRTNAVNQIRLHWQVLVNGVLDESSTAWDCNDNHGVTGFDLPEGKAALWVTPECDPDRTAALDTYIAPAIVERNVIRGETVSLGAVELVVSVSRCRDPAVAGAQDGLRSCICCAAGELCRPDPEP